jgi:PEP-CTERM motif
MRFSSLVKTGFVAFGLATFAGTAQAQGSAVVSHDEWLTGNGTFNASEQQFLTNVLSYFGVSSGNALIYSSNGFLTNGAFTSFLTTAGLTVAVDPSAASFAGYNVVFGGGNPTQNGAGLASYVLGGGHVFYEGGTGTGGAAGESAYSAAFLNGLGLGFATVYNGLNTVNTSGFAGQSPYGPALFTGVNSVFANNGNDIVSSAAVAGVNTQIFDDGSGNGVFAAAQVVTATPEPASLALFATGLIALVPVARRRLRR